MNEEIISFTLWRNVRKAIERKLEITPFRKHGKVFKGSLIYTEIDLKQKKEERHIDKFELKDFEIRIDMMGRKA